MRKRNIYNMNKCNFYLMALYVRHVDCKLESGTYTRTPLFVSTRGYLRSTASESVALTEYGSNCVYLDVTGRETILIFATSVLYTH